jgi:hypothetical protein
MQLGAHSAVLFFELVVGSSLDAVVEKRIQMLAHIALQVSKVDAAMALVRVENVLDCVVTSLHNNHELLRLLTLTHLTRRRR